MNTPYLNLESIAPQGPEFFKELTDFVAMIRLKYPTASKISSQNVLNSKEFDKLITIIAKYTNLKIILSGRDSDTPAVCVGAIGYPHVLYEDTMFNMGNNDLKIALRRSNKSQVEGTVDLKTGKVGGVFTEIPHRLVLGMTGLRNAALFTNEEYAASILHEIGHIVTAIIYSMYTGVTSYLLENMTRVIDGSADFSLRKKYFTNLEALSGLSDEDFYKIADGTDKNGVAIDILDYVLARCTQQLGFNIFSSISAEALADQYAARFGAGKALVTVLDKSNRLNGAHGLNSNKTTINVLSGVAAGLALIPTPITTSIGVFVLVSLLLYLPQVDETYGPVKMRLERILQDNIEQLKLAKDYPDTVNALLAQNDEIRIILKEYTDKRYVMEFIGHWFRPGMRAQRRSINYIRALEGLAKNNLFEMSERIKRI